MSCDDRDDYFLDSARMKVLWTWKLYVNFSTQNVPKNTIWLSIKEINETTFPHFYEPFLNRKWMMISSSLIKNGPKNATFASWTTAAL